MSIPGGAARGTGIVFLYSPAAGKDAKLENIRPHARFHALASVATNLRPSSEARETGYTRSAQQVFTDPAPAPNDFVVEVREPRHLPARLHQDAEAAGVLRALIFK